MSQLRLASSADVSTRHLSYVENGRSRPTSEMIVRLADALDVPMVDQNRMLLAGGFAPRYPQRALDDQALAPVMTGLRTLLDAHAPYPALLLDDHWDLVDANDPVQTLIGDVQPSLLEPPVNVLRLTLHPRGLAPRIRNLGAWRAQLVHQLEHRIAATGGDDDLLALRQELDTYPAPPVPADHVAVDPVALLELEADDGEPLRLFSVATRIESSLDISLAGLHLETFVAADDATRRRFQRPSD